jgi:phosphoenolpyruvate carboxykinase (GTP)
VTSTLPHETGPPTANRKLVEWVERWTAVLEPSRVHWCDGSTEEYDALCHNLVESGTFVPLDPAQRPN